MGLFALSPSNPRIVFAAAETFPGSCLLFKSMDGGSSWEKPRDFYPFFLQNDSRIAVNPADAETLWVLARDLWKSADGGETWESLIARPVIDPLSDLAVSRGNPDRLFVCGKAYNHQEHFFFMDFGRSLDGGLSWTYIPVMTARSGASTMAIDPGDENIIYVGGEKGGAGALFLSLDGGAPPESGERGHRFLPDLLNRRGRRGENVG
jgi:photosystem II stability/assembly factor-like uncharacterized protein